MNWSSWEAYKTTKSWILNNVNGTKRVYAKFKDASGNTTKVYDDILLDTQVPLARMSLDSYSTNNSKTNTFRVNWSATDVTPSSGIAS